MVILRRCDILNHPGGLKGNQTLREGLTAGPSHFAYVPIELRTVSNKACKRRETWTALQVHRILRSTRLLK